LKDQLSEESAELRSLGKQDKVQMAINANISKREYFNGQISSVKYYSRWNEKLAQGWNTDINIGHRFLTGRNNWLIQFDASNISNSLENNLPVQLSRRLPQDADISQIVVSDFSTVGVSTRYSRGQIATNFPQVGSLRYYVEGWVGQVYPSNSFAFRFNSGISTRVVGNDELGLELVVDQTSSKIADQTNVGVKLFYRNYIGR